MIFFLNSQELKLNPKLIQISQEWLIEITSLSVCLVKSMNSDEIGKKNGSVLSSDLSFC